MVFILAATGSAVGLGNIWKFPYLAGEYGGGAFVLVYLLSIALIGIPVMMSEILIGRRGRQSPLNSLKSLVENEGARREWQWIGLVGILSALVTISFYSVIAGWALAYLVRTSAGVFVGVTHEGIDSIFSDLVSDPERLLAWHTIFMVMTTVVVARGVKSGLEQAVKFMMPMLLLLLVFLVVYGSTTGKLTDTFLFLFTPDFSQLSAAGMLEAMGHAFFTLSLGMGAIMIYGSYLPGEVSIGKATLLVAGMDTVIALLAGLAIFPIALANGLAVDSGPGLIFQTLPVAFGQMPDGVLFGALFFLLLVFAAWTSSISLLEPGVAWLVESLNMQRRRAAAWVGLSVWMLGIVTIMSFSSWSFEFEFAGETKHNGMFDIFNILTAGILLPLGGLAIALFCGWIMRRQSVADELGGKEGAGFELWYFVTRYITPLAVFVVFLRAIGVF
ncbi:sodium-dependent transporter [Solemya velesiana gill symbiont]|uniref:Transporter n=2 Tax=Solemya velesiana gill symbiont TaxID=1918948 RepID=A0A1T2KTT6_9GAMM|nr:sodium-dependent transporter [Solemya velesiana gill symbiont]